MDMGLEGKRALVTGGSKGIGRAVARALAAEGARVAICSRDAGVLKETAADIERATGRRIEVVPGDLSRREEVSRVAAESLSRLGRLDILVNNAGAIKGGDFLTTPDEEWLNGWSLKLFGYIRMAREVLPHMQKQGGGRIVNVVGAAARNPAAT
jgi:NAD(P)-dependent dehydrogenase (short-subunit alcohol dehydrogenase family)